MKIKQKLNLLSKIVPKNPSIPATGNYLFKGGQVSASNCQVEFSLPHQSNVDCLLPPSACAFINAAKEEAVIQQVGDTVTIEADGDTYTTVTESTEDFPEIDTDTFDKVFKVDAAKLKQLIQFVSNDELKVAIQNVCIIDDLVFATDMHLLAFFELDESIEYTICIPPDFIKLLPDKEVELELSDNAIRYGGLTALLVNENPPNAKHVINTNHTKHCAFDYALAINKVKKAMVAADAANNHGKMTIKNNAMFFETENLDFTHSVKTAMDCGGDDFEVGLNFKNFQKVLLLHGEGAVLLRYTSPKTPLLLEGEISIVITPVILK